MRVKEKHALWLRLVHWFNVPLLSLMVWSGLLIYWANDVYPGFFPDSFYRFLHIPHRLAEGLYIHFFIGWLFFVNGCFYLLGLFGSGHWRELFPDRNSFRLLIPTVLHDLGLRQVVLPKDKFNAAQRFAYTSVIALGVLGVWSGFAIYKPVQLQFLSWFMGGYEGARLVHFAVMISFCLFVLMHLVQVVRAGWNGFRAMVAGFEVEDEKH